MAKDFYIDSENFKYGLEALSDTTKARAGSARVMKNCIITDRGGIAPRLGTTLLGAENTSAFGIKGIYTFRKSFGTNEVMVKCYDDEMEAYSKNHAGAGWFKVKDGYTQNSEHGFVTSLVNVDNQDYLISCNRFEPYQRWRGEVTQLNGAVSAAATTVTVDSNLASDIFESKTATANSATTLTVAGTPWATNQWVGFYVHITGTGKIRRITSNTSSVITFNTLGGSPGNVAFEVRQLAFPFAKRSATTIAFVDSNPDTITDSGNGFLTAGFKAGDRIIISGAAQAANNGTFNIVTVTAGTITLEAEIALTAETAGATVTIVLASMSITYAGITIPYTDVDLATTFTVGSAHAGADNVAVTVTPELYPQNPRGNRLGNFLNRIVVGNVRSAMARDAGGAQQGFASAGSYFVSKLNNPVDFRFAATRVAGEGDIVSTPYGGGDITDIVPQEDVAYIFKKNYIESVKYSQDANDLAVREPLKAEVGSINRVIKGADDLYFMTTDKRLTSIGRVAARDIKPQTENIGLVLKRLLDTYGVDEFVGIEHEHRVYFSVKSTTTTAKNDITLVYNKLSESFEGIWDIGSGGFTRLNNLLYYGESNGANIYQMLTGKADVVGVTRYPIVSKYATHFMNLTASKANIQALNSLYFEGYIKGGTTITFKAWKDFSDEPFLQFNFEGTETSFLDGAELSASMGTESLALRPLGTISDPDPEGRRHFKFRVYFPFQYMNFFSVGHESSGADLDFEITRYGFMVKEDVSMNQLKVKSI